MTTEIKVETITSDEAAVLNAARDTLKIISERCQKASWEQLKAGYESHRILADPSPSSYGRIVGQAEATDDLLFELLNSAHSYTYCLTADEVHNRKEVE